MAYIYDIADTWNAIGTTFKGIALNVTDSASAAGSLLMDLQVGGVSRFSVGKGGIVTLPQTANTTASLQVTGSGGNSGFGSANAFDWTFTRAGSPMAFFGFSRICVGSGNITWASSPGGAADILLTRDAANTLAQRNGVNAQAFNLYNTYTDASNYERGFMRFVSNTLRIGTEKLGTGTARAIEFYTDGTLAADFQSSGIFTFRTGYAYNITGGFISVWAMQGGVNNWIGMQSNNAFSLRTNNTNRITMDTVGSVQIATALTVATLPATPLVGMMARVTDATTPIVGSTVTGGGAAAALCWYNGANWTVTGV